MRKKLIAVVLSLLMACSMFAGCNKVKSDSEPSESSKPVSDQSSEVSSKEESSSEESKETSSEASTSSKEENTAKPQNTKYPKLSSNKPVKKHKAVAAVGNTAYEYYGYVEDKAQMYTGLVNDTAKKLAGVSDVYAMIIPTSVGITLPDNHRDEVAGGNMEEPMNRLYDAFSSQVKPVRLYDILMKHRDEYIYFRTDHHWTARGAYYAYTELCKQKGIVPHELSDYKLREFDGFLGSFYKDTGNSADLGATPDVVEAYEPVGKNIKLNFTDLKGNTYQWPIIADMSSYPANLKYGTFAAADNPYTVIENPDVTDGSSCIVIKESFGNALIPFLADHYATIYELDYRYWDGNVVSFAKEKQVDDVIFANNISMTRSGPLINNLAKILE